MGTLTVNDLGGRAWVLAQDTDRSAGGAYARYSDTELLLWANDFLRELVNVLPSSNSVSAVRPLVPGHRQTLEGLGRPRGVSILRVACNYAIDLTTPGSAITLIEQKHLDEMRPLWRRDIATEAEHYILDPVEPKAFYLHPTPRDGAVQIVFSEVPAAVTALNNVLPVDDIYFNAALYFVLSRFYLKDTVFSKAPAKASFWTQMFMQSLGVKDGGVVKALAAQVATSNVKGPQP